MIPTIEQQPESVPRGLVRRAALVILIGIVLSVLATALLDRGLGEQQSISTRAPRRIDQEVFSGPTRTERQLRQAAAHLRSYGWIDRERGIIHVPIDVAIDLYLTERAR